MRNVARDKGGVRRGQGRLKEEQRITRRGTHRRRLEPGILEARPSSDNGVSNLARRRQATQGHQGIDLRPTIRVVQQGLDGLHGVGADFGTFDRHSGGVLANSAVAVLQRNQQQAIIELSQIVQRVQGLDAAVLARARLEQLREGGRDRGRLRLEQQAIGRGAHPAVGMRQHRDEPGRVAGLQRKRRQGLGFLVLNPPEARELVIAIRARRGVAGAVGRTAGVVVHRNLIVEIDHVERAIRTHPTVNRPEPVVGAGEELGLLAAVFLAALVGGSLGIQKFVVEQLPGGFTHEEGVAILRRPLSRPSSTVVDGRSGGGRPGADPVDLHVRLTLLFEGRINFVFLDDVEEGLQAAHLTTREDLLGNHNVANRFAAGRRREDDFPIRRDFASPGVATAGSDLLQHRAVGPEPENARRDITEALGAVTRLHLSARVTDRAVHPAIRAPTQIVDDGVRVERAPPGVERLDLVGHTVAGGVPNPQDVRRLGDDHAVPVEHQRGRQFEPVGEHLLLIHHAVPIGIRENGDPILRLTRLLAANREVGRILGAIPIGLEVVLIDVESARIFRRLHHPEPSLGIPVERHDLLRDVFVCGQRHVELGVQLEGFDRFRSRLRSTRRIAKRGQFGRLTKLVHIGPLAGPGDSAQQEGTIMGRVEHVVLVAGQADEGAVRRGAPVPGSFVRPDLRPDVENVHEAHGQNMHVGRHVHLVINFILPVEVGDATGDGILRIDEIEPDLALMPLGLLLSLPAPRAAQNLLGPLVLIAGDDAIMDHHHAAAALEKLLEPGAFLAGDLHAVGGVDDHDVGSVQLGGRRKLH